MEAVLWVQVAHDPVLPWAVVPSRSLAWGKAAVALLPALEADSALMATCTSPLSTAHLCPRDKVMFNQPTCKWKWWNEISAVKLIKPVKQTNRKNKKSENKLLWFPFWKANFYGKHMCSLFPLLSFEAVLLLIQSTKLLWVRRGAGEDLMFWAEHLYWVFVQITAEMPNGAQAHPVGIWHFWTALLLQCKC